MKFKYSIAASAVMLALVAAAAPVSAAAEGLGVLTNDYVNSREHLDQKEPAFATILLSGDKLKKDEEGVLSIQTSGNFYRKISPWLGYNSPTTGHSSLSKGLRAASGES